MLMANHISMKKFFRIKLSKVCMSSLIEEISNVLFSIWKRKKVGMRKKHYAGQRRSPHNKQTDEDCFLLKKKNISIYIDAFSISFPV
jgi:hypothetical protein